MKPLKNIDLYSSLSGDTHTVTPVIYSWERTIVLIIVRRSARYAEQ